MKVVDLKGMKCPMPLIHTKKAIKENTEHESLKLVIDNEASFNNVSRYLNDNNIYNRTNKDGDLFEIIIKDVEDRELSDPEEYCDIEVSTKKTSDSYVAVFAKDTVGSGIPELGYALSNALITTLDNMDRQPEAMVFMNSGINLVVKGSVALPSLKRLADKGVKILVCGACLDFLDKMDDLQVGTVSNMMEITETVLKADKVINY